MLTNNPENNITPSNIISFPKKNPNLIKRLPYDTTTPTPKSDKVIANAERLKRLSKYPCDYDFEIYRNCS